MSVLDKVIAAVVPEPSAEKRQEARRKARSEAGGGWLAQVLDQHEQLETAFEAVRLGATASARRQAEQELAVLLTAHSLAEETVLYPAMALGNHKAHSSEAYVEQSGAKVQIAGLEELDPLSQDYMDKFEHLRSAVSMHMYREESDWFPDLRKDGDAAMQARLTRRYKEEFDRYMSGASSMQE